MSQERYDTSKRAISKMDASTLDLPEHRERYMDSTASLRSLAPAIEQMQNGDRLMMESKFSDASVHYGDALRKAPDDYTALLMMAKCQLALKDFSMAKSFAGKAAGVYPEEPQALHVMGLAELSLKSYESSHDRFTLYEKHLPGNPNTVFYIGLSADGMGNREEAANRYNAYLKEVNKGEKAQYAYSRLKEWGYIK